MKTIVSTTAILFLCISTFAQFPQALKYQAVVRDASGGIIANKSVFFKFTILSGSATGTVIYKENHTEKTTNQFGLADIEIGKGAPEVGTFSIIDWSKGSFFIKVEIFPAGASGWQEMGTTQLLSVPYALFAKDVQNKDDADADPANEIQTISMTGNILSLNKGGGNVAVPGDNWGSQVVRTNNTLTGQGIDASLLGVVSSEIKPLWNNIQSVPAGFADGVDNVKDADADTTNELQDLQLNGTVLGLTKSSKTVNLPSSGGGDNWGTDVVHTEATLTGNGTNSLPLKIAQQAATAGQTLKWDGSTWKPSADNVDDADNNPANEIQTLSISGSNLTLSKEGGTVAIPNDNWGTQVVKTNASLSGQGTESSPLGIVNSQIQPDWNNIKGIPAGFADGIDNVNYADTSSTNELQTLSLSGTQLTLSQGGGTVILPSSGGGDNWGTQIVKTNSSLTGQGTDSNPLGVANSVITPTWANIQNIPSGFADGADNVDDADADPFNEIQSLSITGNNLSLSKGGGTIAIPGDNWGTQSALTNATLTGNGTITGPLGIVQSQLQPVWNNIQSIPAEFADGVDNVNDADADMTNEIQVLSIAGNNLSLSKSGGTVAIPGDNWGTQVAATDVTLTGNGTATTPLKIAQQGATSGQVLMWNGSAWQPGNATGSSFWTQNGSNIYYNNGNVGIGVSNPIHNLDIRGNNKDNGAAFILGNSDLSHRIVFFGGREKDPNPFINWKQGDPFLFTTTTDEGVWSEKMRITSDGNVGIGTTTPASKLDVKGEVNLNSNRIKNVANPVNAQDAATKAYVDALIGQLSRTGAIVADADGNIYPTVRIGSQVWMGENLKTTKFRDGSDIPLVTDATQWINRKAPGYCWYNNDKKTFGDTYGALYNWYAAGTGTLCPTGWHMPGDAEWAALENYLIVNGYNYDGTTTGNKIAKSLASAYGWTSSSTAGTPGNTDYHDKRNATGFSGLPGGYRDPNGNFFSIANGGYWWSSTEYSTSFAWIRTLSYHYANVGRSNELKDYGLSVRCVRDF